MRVIGQLPLLFSQVYEKTVTSDAIGRDSLTVNYYGPTNELAEVIPIEGSAILEFPYQERRSKVSRACQSFRAARRRMSGWSSGRVANMPRS